MKKKKSVSCDIYFSQVKIGGRLKKKIAEKYGNVWAKKFSEFFERSTPPLEQILREPLFWRRREMYAGTKPYFLIHTQCH